MSYTTINKHTDYFNAKLYTGTGADNNAITGVGFQPDFTWLKSRSVGEGHYLQDAVRGATKHLHSQNTDAEATQSNALKSFNSDGFTVGDEADINTNNSTNVSWNWKANGAGSANTDGSINSTVSVNTTAGFSIVSFTGTGANATVGHGLGVAPKVIITKSRANAENWGFYHEDIGNTKQFVLNTTGALTGASSAYYNNTSPTSTLFSVGTADSTNDAANMIAYCFAEKRGYSKIGSYTGNGNANGTFIYLGFKPSFIMLKGNNSENWMMYDNKREGYNVDNDSIHPNTSDAEGTADDIDILSNGFKIRRATGLLGDSGVNYYYMAIGQSLVGSNNVCATAR
jgi:hypothetical protein